MTTTKMNKDDINKVIFGSSLDWYKSINKSMQIANEFNNLFGLTGTSKLVDQASIYEKNIGLNSMLGISAIQNIQKSLKAINPALRMAQTVGLFRVEKTRHQV